MELQEYAKEFGISMLIRNGTSRVLRKIGCSQNILNKYDNYKHKYVQKYLEKEFLYEIEKVILPSVQTSGNEHIFVFWWQGEMNAPDIVKCCIASVRAKYPERLIVLCEKNYKEFCSLPDVIVEKFEKGFISLAHFSDIIRFHLLYYWGGVWMDATDLLIKEIPQDVLDKEFYSVTNFYTYSLGWKWTSFFLSAKPKGIIAEKMLKFYYAYWSRYDYAVTYLFLDCWLTVLYESDEQIRSQIDSISDAPIYMPFTNGINWACNDELFEDMCRKSFFFNKLTYKQSFISWVDDGKTVYQILKEKYKVNS